LESGADSIGVSSLEEAINLRNLGIAAPLLILGSIFPLENFSVALDYKITPTVASLEAAQALARVAARKKRIGAFHLKVDTGMGRFGVSPAGARRVLAWVRDQTAL